MLKEIEKEKLKLAKWVLTVGAALISFLIGVFVFKSFSSNPKDMWLFPVFALIIVTGIVAILAIINRRED